jgi:hypothetical protein
MGYSKSVIEADAWILATNIPEMLRARRRSQLPCSCRGPLAEHGAGSHLLDL